MHLELIALGPLHMIRVAINEHYKRTQGRYPRCIVLHPAVMYDFLDDLGRTYGQAFVIDGQIDGGGHIFMHTEISMDEQADRPKLITWNNQVEYL